MEPETLKVRVELIYDMLQVAILNGDRKHVLVYARYLARERQKQGIGLQ